MKKMKRRIYQCDDCGQKVVITTNHEGQCYPTCKGKCRQITNPHTERERVSQKQTTHHFIEDYDGNKAPDLILVD